jgi:chromosome segregation ATPase
MTTQELIRQLRWYAAPWPPTDDIHAETADRLEKLHQKCNMHYETICDLTKERDQARAEVERLKATVEDLNHVIENQRDRAIVNQQLTTRPEMSRLEIAAMAMQGFIGSSAFIMDVPNKSLEYADALIAAAKEAK